MDELRIAKDWGTDAEIAAAEAKVKAIVEGKPAEAPDFGAGARPMAPQPVDMSTLIRRARYGGW